MSWLSDRNPSADLRARLGDPDLYARQIERLHRKHLFTSGMYLIEQDGVSLASMVFHRRRVARLLARGVRRGEYRSGPATLRVIRANGKERTVYAYALTDALVHGAVADVLDEALQGQLSGRLYSYRKGVAWWTSVQHFAGWVRGRRKAAERPRARGVYAIRRDVDAYTDSIPVQPSSPVWTKLGRLLDPTGDGGGITEAVWSLIRGVVRPEVRGADGAARTPLRGIPTGQPISCVLFNLYLAELDHEMERIPGSFYARYSDDILFAHPDPEVAREADALLETRLAELGLRANDEKGSTLYLNSAGRASDAWGDARGVHSVPFLGCAVSASGTVALKRDKVRTLLRDLESRCRRVARAMNGATRDEIGRAACAAVNATLADTTDPLRSPTASLLHHVVTDRPQLKQLDYWIARLVLRIVTRDGSIKRFREVPYRAIRERWGLRSLLHARNRSGRR